MKKLVAMTNTYTHTHVCKCRSTFQCLTNLLFVQIELSSLQCGQFLFLNAASVGKKANTTTEQPNYEVTDIFGCHAYHVSTNARGNCSYFI